MADETPQELPQVDEPPKSGEFADEHPSPTDEEIAVGNQLGEDIDVENDDDNGGVEPPR